MARGVTYNKSDRALDKVLKFNEKNHIEAPPTLNIREQIMKANIELERRRIERENRRLAEEIEETRYIKDCIYFSR